ncbi:MAG: hypothetical protein ACK2UC_01135 [Anaerolineae bacterium]|jgi:uncharacterized protein (DUF2267 family)
MDELVKLVSKKVGIPEAQARQAVEVVVDFLKKQLPQPIAAQVEAAAKGDVGDLGDLAGSLGGMLGKK